MLTHMELPFDYLFLIVSSQFIVVFTLSTADNCFGLVVLISTVRWSKNSLKMFRNNIIKILFALPRQAAHGAPPRALLKPGRHRGGGRCVLRVFCGRQPQCGEPRVAAQGECGNPGVANLVWLHRVSVATPVWRTSCGCTWWEWIFFTVNKIKKKRY